VDRRFGGGLRCCYEGCRWCRVAIRALVVTVSPGPALAPARLSPAAALSIAIPPDLPAAGCRWRWSFSAGRRHRGQRPTSPSNQNLDPGLGVVAVIRTIPQCFSGAGRWQTEQKFWRMGRKRRQAHSQPATFLPTAFVNIRMMGNLNNELAQRAQPARGRAHDAWLNPPTSLSAADQASAQVSTRSVGAINAVAFEGSSQAWPECGGLVANWIRADRQIVAPTARSSSLARAAALSALLLGSAWAAQPMRHHNRLCQIR